MNPKLGMKGLLCGCLLAVTSACGSSTPAASGASPEIAVAPTTILSSGTYGGKTYAEWGTSFLQWQLNLPGPRFPVMDRTGAWCTEGQDTSAGGSPVFFLSGGVGTIVRTCTIPANRMILVPLASWMADNVGLPEGTPPRTDTELQDLLYRESKAVSEVTLSVDGVSLGSSVSDFLPYFVFATEFSYAVPDTPYNYKATFGDAPFSGTVPVAFNGGVWALLAPLPAGSHTIYFSETSVPTPMNPAGSSMGVTYELTVE
jgi:hypothetical protein